MKYHYQKPLVRAAVDAVREFGVFADTSATGVGKTYVALQVARDLGRDPFVVCPKAVAPHWREASAELGVPLVDAVNYEKVRAGSTPWGGWKIKKRVFRWDLDPDRHLLIFDEAHRLSGPTSQTSKLLVAAKRDGVPCLLLSATLADSPLKMKAVGYALDLHAFANFQYWLYDNGVRKDNFGALVYRGGPEGVARIRGAAGARIGGLRHDQVPNFPASRVESWTLPVTADVDREYMADLEAMRDGAADEVVATLRSRQIAELAKVAALVELGRDLVAEGNAVAVFVNFRDTLARVRSAFGCPEIRGGQTTAEREAAIADFQAGRAPVIVSMVQAGGQGIGLHDTRGDAPRVALISPTWSAVDFRQVLGRVRRAGAKSPSRQLVCFADGSEVEGRVRARLDARLDRIDALNDSDLSICDPL